MESHKCAECGHLHYVGGEVGYEPCLIEGCDCLGQTEDGRPALSFKCEVEVEGKWASNGLRFASSEEAEAYGRDLLARWFVPTGSRAAPTAEPVNTRRVEHGWELIHEAPEEVA